MMALPFQCCPASLGQLVLGLASIITAVSCNEPCNPQILPSLQTVHAYDARPVPCLAGCTSDSSSDLKVSEIHVINLRTSAPSTSQTTTPARPMDLHFMNRLPGMIGHSLVFILNSPAPVHWQITGEDMLPIPLHTVQIVLPHNSTASTLDNDLPVGVEYMNLPHGNTDLINYVQDQYDRSPNTFCEVLDANSFKLQVGTNPNSRATCVIQQGFQNADFTAQLSIEQPTVGCQSDHLQGPPQHEFHLILLQSAGAGSSSSSSSSSDRRSTGGPPGEVAVELLPGRSSNSDVVLVLVSDDNITWTVDTAMKRGRIQVVSPNAVSVVEDVESSVERRALPRDTDALLAWAQAQEGPVTSFTRAQAANKFTIKLEHRQTSTSAARPLSKMDILKQYTEVQCHRSRIEVRILRAVMDVFQLSADSMGLVDPTCRAVESGDYYAISTQRENCGTTRSTNDAGHEIYANEVVFSNSDSLLDGSGDIDPGLLPRGGLPVDDEQTLAARVPVACEYLANGEPVQEPFKDKVTLSMHMYSSNSYQHRLESFPVAVQVGERVYFEVSLSESTSLNIVPSQCWLSPGWGMMVQQVYMLIYNGCPVDESLIFHHDSSYSLNLGRSRHFSFEAPDIQMATPYLYVHCQLGICSDDGTGSNIGIPKCADIMDPDTGCLVENKQNGLEVDFSTRTIYVGPYKSSNSAIVLPDGGVKYIPEGNENDNLRVTAVQEADCQVSGLQTGSAAAIAVASFMMGMVLMAALWWIHTHTGPHTGPPPSASPCTVSTASSPSANGHLLNGHLLNGHIPNGHLPNGAIPREAAVYIPNGHLPNGYLPANNLNPNGIPLHGMRHVETQPEDV